MNPRRAEKAAHVVATLVAAHTAIWKQPCISAEARDNLTILLEGAIYDTTQLLVDVASWPDAQHPWDVADSLLRMAGDELFGLSTLAQPAPEAFWIRQRARKAYRELSDLLIILSEVVVADDMSGKALACEAIYYYTVDHPALRMLHTLAAALYDDDPPLAWGALVTAALPLMCELNAYRTSLR